MIKAPVSLDKDSSIVDADGRVIAIMTWLGDLDHLRKQTEVGRFICEAVNEKLLRSAEPVAEAASVKEEGQNGSGILGKIKNPWGRAGRPK